MLLGDDDDVLVVSGALVLFGNDDLVVRSGDDWVLLDDDAGVVPSGNALMLLDDGDNDDVWVVSSGDARVLLNDNASLRKGSHHPGSGCSYVAMRKARICPWRLSRVAGVMEACRMSSMQSWAAVPSNIPTSWWGEVLLVVIFDL